MQIELVEFEFGMTQNLGDYSNTRPSLKLVARLTEGEDVDIALEALTATAVQTVHGLVDDELEQSGREVKYTFEQLYQVSRSDVRACVVIFPAGKKLPEEKTWREADIWRRPYHVDRQYPNKMRIELAQYIADVEAENTGFELVHLSDGDMSQIPPLPDPGPQPAWHAKNLEKGLRQLHIMDEATRGELGELEHVTREYLDALYNKDAERRLTGDELVALIRSGQPFGETAPEPEDEEEDEYQEDYDDDEEDDAPF